MGSTSIVLAWLASAYLGAVVGWNRKAAVEGVCLGLVFGPLGLLAACFVDRRDQCCQCNGRLNGRPKICEHCRTELAWAQMSLKWVSAVKRSSGILFVPFLLSCSVLVAAPGDQLRSPRPDAAAVAKAEKEVREIFAADIEKAKTPAEKAKLAREFLATAQKTSDSEAGRFVLLALARDLAVEGRDRKTALDAVLAIVERYQPDGPTESREQFEKARGLWEEAEKVSCSDRLRKQLDAAEWYARAKAGATGITKQFCEKRLGEAAETSSTEGKRPGKPSDLKILIGTWEVKVGRIYTGSWVFRTDGTVLKDGRSPGRWIVDTRSIKITWTDDGAWESFFRPLKTEGVLGDSIHGPGLVFAKKTESSR